MENVEVRLSGNQIEKVVQTGKDGTFTFRQIPPGRYKVILQVPKAATVESFSPDIRAA